ncbi:hypothetical protein PUR71_31355 [Streptomyces sp. SP17BM10]|uniref:hypothetical protein n=1 Tax=Streptomyces sp. SP17BM10 TaxID=3002530 RepID=UPI002E798DBD|nr:hypothetical protein [Streptomyces sp. SP17BM10]MEE1787366.1 hypothetical protein [Streptomyces sp. SP17BM10]
MEGTDRRTEAACPRPAARYSLHTPVRVVEPDPDEPGASRAPGGRGRVDPAGRVSASVRLHGHLPGLVTATGTAGGPAAPHRALVDASPREPRVPAPSTATPAARPGRAGRARVPAGPCTDGSWTDRTGRTGRTDHTGRRPIRGAAGPAAPPRADARSAARSGSPRPGCPSAHRAGPR